MIIIGEKINGSIPSVAKAIAVRDEEYIRDLAKKQADANSSYIDVCASVKDDIEVETLKWLIGLVQQVTDTPISVDSPNPRACVAALPFCQKEGLVNSVSMEGDKIDVIFPVIADTDWECIALLCDDMGIPKTAEKRLQVFEEIMLKAKEFGIKPSRLHIDPLVEMLCTSEDGINKITHVIREIKKQYPEIHVTGAVSNVSFNLPMRKLINQSFAVLAMNSGMDSAILDPTNGDLLGVIYAANALLANDEYCMNYVSAYRQGLFGSVK